MLYKDRQTMNAIVYIHDARLFLQSLYAEIPTMNWLPRTEGFLLKEPGAKWSMKNRGRDQVGGTSHCQKRLRGSVPSLGDFQGQDS